MTPGYWPQYGYPDYAWPDDYWPEYGGVVITGVITVHTMDTNNATAQANRAPHAVDNRTVHGRIM